MTKPNLKDLLAKDSENAVERPGFDNTPLEPGTYTMKIISFNEEENYNMLIVEIDKKKYNFFYNYYIYGTTDLDKNLIDWIKGLATIPVTPETSLLDIANSAIGSSYEVTVYNYTTKSGKNAGKKQHAIDFKTLPVLSTNQVNIQEDELDLPF